MDIFQGESEKNQREIEKRSQHENEFFFQFHIERYTALTRSERDSRKENRQNCLGIKYRRT